ncbi:HEAT repeat domain-containing protein [Actinoplanes sp. NPDC000266]
MRKEVQADPEEGTSYQLIWQAEPSVEVSYFDDEASGARFLVVVAEDAGAARATGERLESGLDTWRVDDLVAAVDDAENPVELARAVLRAGVGAPEEPDERFLSRITRAMRHEDERVRETAIWAATYVPRPQYRSALIEVRDHDDSDELRELAEITLESYDDANVPRP